MPPIGAMIKVIHDDICMYDIGLSMRNPVKKKLIATGTKRFQAISKWSRTALSRPKLGELGTTMIILTEVMLITKIMVITKIMLITKIMVITKMVMITKMIVISWKMNRVMVVVVKMRMRMWFQKTSNFLNNHLQQHHPRMIQGDW